MTSRPVILKGSDLRQGRTSIGRGDGCDITIKDDKASRQHFAVIAENGTYWVEDTGSANGTFVNGARVQRRELAHGDSIRLGGTTIRFLRDDSEVASRVDFEELEQTRLLSGETVHLDTSASFLSDDALRRNRDLAAANALLQLSEDLLRYGDPEDLQDRLLERLFDFIPAENAAILLVGDDAQHFVSERCWQRTAGSGGHVRVSRTVTREVLSTGKAIMRNDLLTDAEIVVAGGSIPDSKARSLLCVPLDAVNRRVGVIYAYSTEEGVRFDEGHLRWLSAMARIASVALDHAEYVNWITRQNQHLAENTVSHHGMIGNSPAMKAVYQQIERVAPADRLNVLLLGETGTGKDLVARAIHQASPRASGPFVAINISSIPPDMLAGELFGWVKGAHSMATSDKPGVFEQAHGGTLFLNEIGDMPYPQQSAVLMAIDLNNPEIRRMGDTKAIRVDVRVIAATNHNIDQLIEERKFRADLRARLNHVTIKLPPLRERREDIEELAYFFLKQASLRSDVIGIAPATLRILQTHRWPENVRQLESAIRRAVAFCSTSHLMPEDLPEDVYRGPVAASAGTTSFDDQVKAFKRQLLLGALKDSKNVTEAAKSLALHPNYLFRLIRQFGLGGQY